MPTKKEPPSDALLETQETPFRGNSSLLKLWKSGKIRHSENAEVTDPKDPRSQSLQDFRLERDNNLPLRFQGYLFGQNKVNQKDHFGTEISIYLTRSNKIVVYVYQWQRREGQFREKRKASVHESPNQALEWLIEDGKGKLGKASREAWTLACLWEPFRGYDVEILD